jgi:RNA polymerase sigma factor (sigma-70 family)
MKHLSDDTLLEYCRQGHREAFNELVKRYQHRIYWTIRRFVADSDDAYDIAQDVFIKAFQGIREFRGDSQVFTWLYRIAANLSINHVRKRNLRSFLSLDILGETLGDPDSAPDHLVERNETTSTIERAVQTLPEKQKAVFVLRYYQDLSYEEIAEILHRSVGGLKANYFHAVRKIEEYVKHAL